MKTKLMSAALVIALVFSFVSAACALDSSVQEPSPQTGSASAPELSAAGDSSRKQENEQPTEEKTGAEEKPASADSSAKANNSGEASAAEDKDPVYIKIEIRDYDGNEMGEAYYNPLLDTEYISMVTVGEWCEIEVTEKYSTVTGAYSATAEGMELSLVPEKEYATVNGRYVYLPGGFVMIDGVPCFPMSAVCHVFSYEMEYNERAGIIMVRTDGDGVISGDENYYYLTYGMDNIKWLSRIINAESLGEPMACKIGVGNVVLNRVKDKYFPNTVEEVIFHVDENGTVQFTPTETGGVYGIPDDDCKIAAYLCYEGFNTVGDSEYFVEPEKGLAQWFVETLRFTCTLGNIDFYADPKATTTY